MPKVKSSKSSGGHKSSGGKSSRAKPSGDKPSGSRHKRSEGSGSNKAGESSSNTETAAGQMDLRIAIYRPAEGNYYHWAFVAYVIETQQFHLFEVTSQDGQPFQYTYRQTDPESSIRHEGSIPLAAVSQDWLRTVANTAQGIPVPGEGTEWNCQDYVMELWEALYQGGVVGLDEYENGRSYVMPFYGPDYGGGADDGDELMEEVEEESRVVRSEAYARDSSSDE